MAAPDAADTPHPEQPSGTRRTLVERILMLPRALRGIADELESRRTQVLAEVEGLSQHQADWRPARDQWSLGEVLHHLVLAEGIAGKMVSVAVKRVADAGSVPPNLWDAFEGRSRDPSLLAIREPHLEPPVLLGSASLEHRQRRAAGYTGQHLETGSHPVAHVGQRNLHRE